jgi:hypothetical protein
LARFSPAFATVCFCLALAACGSSDSDVAVFTRNDQTISVDAGQQFRVELAASPGVGDDWRLVETGDPTVVELVGEEWVSEVEDPPPGSSGTTVFTFEARGAGTTGLAFYNCYRCGSSDEPPPDEAEYAETIRFDLQVS